MDTRNPDSNSSDNAPKVSPPHAYGQGYYYGPYAYGGMERSAVPSEGYSIAELMDILKRKKQIVILMVLCFCLLGYIYILVKLPDYRAEAIIELSLRRPRIMTQQEAVIDPSSGVQSVELFNTQLLKVQGKSLRSKVVAKVWNRLSERQESIEDCERYFEKHISISQIRRSSLVKISALTHSRDEAVMLANLYAQEAVEDSYSINRESSKSAVAWLESQIETQGIALKKSDDAILGFRKANPVELFETQRDSVKQAIMKYSEDLTKAVAGRDELLGKYTDKHPEVMAQAQVIAAARLQLNEEMRKLEDFENKIASAKVGMAELERERRAVEISYNGILQRIEEARLSSDENTATVKIVEKAVLPDKPVYPRKFMVLILSLLAGVGSGVLLAVLNYRIEDRIWGIGDIEQFIGTKLIGLIPKASKKIRRNELALISYEEKFSLISEAFNNVRGFIDVQSQNKVFMLTSSEPEEGKTISSCNLAISSAKSGVKTLLIEMDMRRPRISQIWKMPDSAWSLLHALCDEGSPDFNALPRKTDVVGLDVIVSHSAPDINPADVLGTARVRDFLKWAASAYDRVIIDSPPVGITSDSLIIGRLAECVIVVGRFNKTRKTLAKSTIKRLVDNGANVIGMIVNDVDLNKGEFNASAMSYGYYPSQTK